MSRTTSTGTSISASARANISGQQRVREQRVSVYGVAWDGFASVACAQGIQAGSAAVVCCRARSHLARQQTALTEPVQEFGPALAAHYTPFVARGKDTLQRPKMCGVSPPGALSTFENSEGLLRDEGCDTDPQQSGVQSKALFGNPSMLLRAVTPRWCMLCRAKQDD